MSTTARMTDAGSQWIWHEVALLAVVLSEIAVLSAWHTVLAAPPASWFASASTLFAVLLGSHITARLLGNLRVPLAHQRTVFGIWTVVCITASLKALYFGTMAVPVWEILWSPIAAVVTPDQDLRVVWHTLMIIWIAYRGIRLARLPLTHFEATQTFQLGLLGMLFLGFLYAWIDIRPAGWMFFSLYGFLFFGLFGMITARIARLGDLRGGRLPSFGRNWALWTLLSTFVVVGAAVVSGWLLGGQIGLLLAAAFLTSMALLTGVVLFFLSPIILLLVGFLPKIEEIIARAIPSIKLEGLQALANTAVETAQDFATRNAIDISQTGKALTILLILVALLALIFISLRRAQVRLQIVGETDVEQIGGRPAGKNGESSGKRKTGFFNARQALAAARIRRIYAQLMDLAEKLGVSRPASQTPLEYLPRLQSLFPEESGNVSTITDAYLRIRYGELPELDEEVRKVTQAWKQVQANGRKKLSGLPKRF